MSVRLLPHQIQKTSRTFPRDGISYGIRLMGAPALWAAGFDGEGVTVGIIDTGIDEKHPDLKGKVIARRDYVGDRTTPDNFHPHGTHVAGSVAANGRLKGVAPSTSLRDYRVLNEAGAGVPEAATQAIRDAADDGCQILNLSLGAADDDPHLHAAVQYAVQKGSLVIVAVGNDGPDHVSYPGYYPEVIGVGAVGFDRNGAIYRADFSNTNPEVDLSVPGVDVVSCAPGGGYLVLSGTSMASPHAAGFAALILQRGQARLGRPMTEESAWEALKISTADVEPLGIDAGTGAGFLTIYPTLPTGRKALTAQARRLP